MYSAKKHHPFPASQPFRQLNTPFCSRLQSASAAELVTLCEHKKILIEAAVKKRKKNVPLVLWECVEMCWRCSTRTKSVWLAAFPEEPIGLESSLWLPSVEKWMLTFQTCNFDPKMFSEVFWPTVSSPGRLSELMQLHGFVDGGESYTHSSFWGYTFWSREIKTEIKDK